MGHLDSSYIKKKAINSPNESFWMIKLRAAEVIICTQPQWFSTETWA